MLGVALLLLGAATAQVDDSRALVCLTLTKLRLNEDQEQVDKFMESCPFARTDVHNKVLTEMLLTCYVQISNATVQAISSTLDTFQLSEELRALVPLPSAPYQTEEELDVVAERRAQFTLVVERARHIQQEMEYNAIQGSWYSGKTGLLYTLGVFALFALGLIKLFRSLGKNAKKPKKTR